MRTALLLPCALLLSLVITACCLGEQGSRAGSYSVDSAGMLSLDCPPCHAEETVLSTHGGYTVNRVILRSAEGDVYALAAIPEDPVAGFVLAPGAGVRKEGHRGRAEEFASHGYAYFILDVRGNGGETAGHPMDLEEDYKRFAAGLWPQYYLSVCDISSARAYLREKTGMPVYAAGESNGGRYAAIAAALDRDFAGFIGISTSGFSRAGESYPGDAGRFLLSVDPEVQGVKMKGRSSWVFHAPGDSVIPLSAGRALYDALPDPKQFILFNGTHGLNGEVDARILGECAQIYGTRR